MLLALAAAAVGLLPTASATADAIWAYLMPLGAACYLLESDLSQLLGSAGPTLAAFVVGAVGTLAGTLVAFWLVGPRLGPDGWKVAASLCASYIGGAVNFAAVSQALGLAPGPLLAGAMTADNCAMALYFLAIMSIPAEQGNPAAAVVQQQQQQQQASNSTTLALGNEHPAAAEEGQQPAMTAESVSLSLAAAALACCLGNSMAAAAGIGSCALAVMALLASFIATAASRLAAALGGGRSAGASPFRGAECLGGAAMMLFFATIGASAGSLQVLGGCGWLLVFIMLQLSIHLAICLAGGRLLHLPMQAILIASNANVGGPATAAAMASAKGWAHMVQPAMLTGALGYAVATGIGIAVGGWLKTWF
ncbi:hypothetical protein ABPG75_012652 [Micractinium tetrahymenae]